MAHSFPLLLGRLSGKAGNVLLMDAGVKPLKTIRMAYTLLDVWIKATVVPNVDSTKWRKDQCGAWIGWEYYGDRSSDYGWEIDHITPVSKGGLDILSNVRPLQWKNNASRQDDRLCCKITSSGNKNVEK